MPRSVLKKIVENIHSAVDNGVYNIDRRLSRSESNLIESIKNNSSASLITEVKFSSPSKGYIRAPSDPVKIAKDMVAGGAIGLSVLTQPYLFSGSPSYFMEIRKEIGVPLLMKDFIVDKLQIDAAEKMGADCILLIQAIFDQKFVKDLDEFIAYAQKKKLLVLLESHTKSEFRNARRTMADLLGINNRNLDTLEINLDTTKILLKDVKENRVLVSESGIETQEDVRFLYGCGARAFLVGTSIMKRKDVRESVSNLASSIRKEEVKFYS